MSENQTTIEDMVDDSSTKEVTGEMQELPVDTAGEKPPVEAPESELAGAEGNSTPQPGEKPPVETPESEHKLILEKLDRLQQSFEAKIKYDATKERMVDTLHSELQTYREDLHFKILRPLLMDLISLYDDFDKLLEHISPADETETKRRKDLLSFQSSVEEILSKQGVEIYTETEIVPKRQRVIKTVSTTEPEKDKQIAAHLRPGFAYEERILRPELISTFRYEEIEKE